MKDRFLILAVTACLVAPSASQAGQGAAVDGESMWNRLYTDQSSGQGRSCASCHTGDLKKPGRHARTGKPIEPMAPSVNPARLSDAAKVEKWFTRNCKWTLGRKCSTGEKSDFLAFIRSQ